MNEQAKELPHYRLTEACNFNQAHRARVHNADGTVREIDGNVGSIFLEAGDEVITSERPNHAMQPLNEAACEQIRMHQPAPYIDPIERMTRDDPPAAEVVQQAAAMQPAARPRKTRRAKKRKAGRTRRARAVPLAPAAEVQS